MTRKTRSRQQAFGGEWTERKLTCLRQYLEAYMKVMKNKRDRFRLVYLDAFAGAGHRYPAETSSAEDDGIRLWPSVTQQEKAFFEGSAKIALNLDPGFDYMVFVEENQKNVARLEELKGDDPRVIIKEGDANTAIQRYCERGDWSGERTGKKSKGVVFLDPFGMQVKWETVKAIAATGALDMWYLFPSGLGANRMAARDRSRIQESWEKRLDLCLGTIQWQTNWYRKRTEPTLFGKEEREVKIANIDVIEEFFIERLKTVFPCVAPKALELRNSQGYKMFSLCFAAGARPERGGNTALRIATHLLDPPG